MIKASKIVVTDFLFFLHKQLLETIEKNGEFERYVVMLTDREEREHRELRRRERERQRLIKGDDYLSDHESEGDKEEEPEEYDDETDSDYDSEN